MSGFKAPSSSPTVQLATYLYQETQSGASMEQLARGIADGLAYLDLALVESDEVTE